MILKQNKKARKQRAFNLHNSLLFKEVPPTGLEPVRPCGQQMLSLQGLTFRLGGRDRPALVWIGAGIQARITSGL